jgi:hypothetical protein
MTTFILCCLITLVILWTFQVILRSIFKLEEDQIFLPHRSIQSNQPFVLYCLQIKNLNLSDTKSCDKFVIKKTSYYKSKNITKTRDDLLKQIKLEYPNYFFEKRFENCCDKYYPKKLI